MSIKEIQPSLTNREDDADKQRRHAGSIVAGLATILAVTKGELNVYAHG